ncbi:MAG TPA: pyrroline-5-carboxylate reductase [Persephonella sp.]|nr:pyrroline-5-carboxylate reductase [Hydrogenothermaceae bacterium]HIQ24903.1 pyrroline-5-carboxylate reductase [Persephonella sp.]
MFKVGIIGIGNMGEAILKGILSNTNISSDEIIVSDKNKERINYIVNKYSVAGTDNNERLVKLSDIVFLTTKPKDMEKVLSPIENSFDNRVLISVLAGVKIDKIKKFAKKAKIVRIMPNTPAIVGESATGVSFDNTFSEEEKENVLKLLNAFGKSIVVEEELMDAITGLSGSGPAYVLTFIDSLAQGGVKQGLSYQQALELATQTVFGTAKMLLEIKEHPSVLRDKVTSPAGTTIYGLHELEKGKLKDTVINAIELATKRSKELSEE